MIGSQLARAARERREPHRGAEPDARADHARLERGRIGPYRRSDGDPRTERAGVGQREARARRSTEGEARTLAVIRAWGAVSAMTPPCDDRVREDRDRSDDREHT